jgi:hypothetical protein
MTRVIESRQRGDFGSETGGTETASAVDLEEGGMKKKSRKISAKLRGIDRQRRTLRRSNIAAPAGV